VSKYGVFGAGNIGCYVGGRLAAAGNPTAMVGRAPLMTEARTSGITLKDVDGNESRVVPPSFSAGEDPELLADAEVVFVCVKSPGTPEAARILRSALPSRCVVISFQNGLRNTTVLREGLPGRTVLGGMVSFNVVRGPGPAFHQATSGPLVIEAGPGAEGAARALRSARFEVEVRPDFVEVQWSKLLLNLNNAVNALSGIPLKAQLSQRGYRRIFAAAQREALAALKMAGVKPVSFGRMIPRLVPIALGLPDFLFFAVARTMIEIDPEARSSMAEDLERGRKTEIDHLNGEVVRLADEAGVPAPVNRRLVELVKAAESAGKGSPRFSTEELNAKVMG
jgi:2-dehydropantoate 2-reductase